MPQEAHAPRGRKVPVALLSTALVACLASKTTEADGRFVAVHNALVATGLAQTGKMQRGVLREGEETKLPVHLELGCSTLVAFGGKGVADIGLALVDGDGTTVAEDKTKAADASVRYCSEKAGDYTLALKMQKGAGDYVTSAWGGAPSLSGAQAQGELARRGTCTDPFALTDGILRGNTKKGQSEDDGSCAANSSSEQVYQLRVDRPTLLKVGFDGRAPAILYLRKNACDDESAEVACSADGRAPGEEGAFAEVLEKGTYYLFVDGYPGQEGPYSLDVTEKPVPSPDEACKTAKPLPLGAPVQGRLSADEIGQKPRCAAYTGPFTPYVFDLAQPMRVRLRAASTAFHPFVFLRKDCKDQTAEMGCSTLLPSMNDSVLVTSLPAGRYWAFVGAENDRTASGAFTLEAEAVPAAGTGNVPGDTCANAIEVKGTGTVSGDTFLAADDGPTCAGASSPAGNLPEVYYRFKLARPTLLEAVPKSSEGAHSLALLSSCGGAPIECSQETLTKELQPGTYWLAVEGPLSASPMSGAGSFDLDLGFRDLGAIKKACDTAPKLERNKTVKGSLRGSASRFAATCVPGSGVDRIYRVEIQDSATYEFNVTATGGWSGGIALRDTCAADSSETACASTDDGYLSTELARGTYYLVVKGGDGTNAGDFELSFRRSPNMP